MTGSQGKFFLYYNETDLEKLVDKFGTTDKQKLKKLMHDFVLETSKSFDTQIESTELQQSSNTLENALKRSKIALNTLKIWNQIRHDGYSLEQLKDLLDGKPLDLPENKTFYSEETIIEPSNPSNQKLQHNFKTLGTTIINKPRQILQEDGTLRCKHCNKKIEMRAFNFEQLDDYRNHVESIHGALTEIERAELLEIYPN